MYQVCIFNLKKAYYFWIMNLKITTLTVIFAFLIMSCGDGKTDSEQATDMMESTSDEVSEELSETMDEASSSSSDCEQFCDDYEAFVDDYIEVLKKYKANPSDMSILTEYSSMMSKASSMQNASADCAGDLKAAARMSASAMKMAQAAM